MKAGAKIRRLCCACGEIREQVRDDMRQNGDRTWICGACSKKRWEALVSGPLRAMDQAVVDEPAGRSSAPPHLDCDSCGWTGPVAGLLEASPGWVFCPYCRNELLVDPEIDP